MTDSIRHMYPNIKETEKIKEKVHAFITETKPLLEKAQKDNDLSDRMTFLMLSELTSQHLCLPYSKAIAEKANQLIDPYRKGE